MYRLDYYNSEYDYYVSRYRPTSDFTIILTRESATFHEGCINDQIPDVYIVSPETVLRRLQKVKVCKAPGPGGLNFVQLCTSAV